jgi:hypothetical protein
LALRLIIKLEIFQLLLGIQFPKNVKILKVGAISNARWLAKILCLLKAAFLMDHFPMEDWEAAAVFRLVEFIVCIYAYQWFNAKSAKDAPFNQLKLIRDICAWYKIDPEIADIALHKLFNHLWYLTAELTPFALCSDKVTADEKRDIAKAILKNKGGPVRLGRPLMKPITKNSTLASRIDSNSLFLFQRLHIGVDWLEEPVATWNEIPGPYFMGIHGLPKVFHWPAMTHHSIPCGQPPLKRSFQGSPPAKQEACILLLLWIPHAIWACEIPAFKTFKTFVENLEIVNDSCERAVKTTADFASKYENDETEFQNALLVVNQARKSRPNCLKSSFVQEKK